MHAITTTVKIVIEGDGRSRSKTITVYGSYDVEAVQAAAAKAAALCGRATASTIQRMLDLDTLQKPKTEGR